MADVEPPAEPPQPSLLALPDDVLRAVADLVAPLRHAYEPIDGEAEWDRLRALATLALACKRLRGIVQPAIDSTVVISRINDLAEAVFRLQNDTASAVQVRRLVVDCAGFDAELRRQGDAAAIAHALASADARHGQVGDMTDDEAKAAQAAAAAHVRAEQRRLMVDIRGLLRILIRLESFSLSSDTYFLWPGAEDIFAATWTTVIVGQARVFDVVRSISVHPRMRALAIHCVGAPAFGPGSARSFVSSAFDCPCRHLRVLRVDVSEWLEVAIDRIAPALAVLSFRGYPTDELIESLRLSSITTIEAEGIFGEDVGYLIRALPVGLRSLRLDVCQETETFLAPYGVRQEIRGLLGAIDEGLEAVMPERHKLREIGIRLDIIGLPHHIAAYVQCEEDTTVFVRKWSSRGLRFVDACVLSALDSADDSSIVVRQSDYGEVTEDQAAMADMLEDGAARDSGNETGSISVVDTDDLSSTVGDDDDVGPDEAAAVGAVGDGG